MKKLFLFLSLFASSVAAFAQSSSFTLTTAPCNSDGVLTANFTGLTPPLTVQWTTMGTSGTTITHTGVTGLSDALTAYSGGPVSLYVTDAASGHVYNYYTGAPPFTFTLATTAAACPALGSATATVTGGSSPYTYSWYNVATSTTVGTTNPVSLPGGNYGVKITDASGCVYGSMFSDDSISGSTAYIETVLSFSVALTPTTASCTNGTVSSTVSSGAVLPVSYLWSNGATTSSISGLSMGSYSLTVTDAAGCAAPAYTYVPQSITISAPTTPTPATCLDNNGGVIAFGSGGVSPYTYLWSNGATTQSQTGIAAGSYYVTVTDANGCLGNGYAYVSTSTPITATYTSTASLCTAPTGTATLALSGGTSPYSITWYTSPVQTAVTATSLAPGNYGFHVTDAVGCVQSGYVNVSPIDIINTSFSTTSALCTLSTGGITVTPSGGAAPYTYTWNTGATTSSLSSVPGGYYSVTITDNASCSVTKSHEVPVSSPLGVGLSATEASCIFTNDGSLSAIAYGGTTPYTYGWSSGGSTSTISGLPAGSYWLNVSDASGCTASRYAYLGYNTTADDCYCTISGTVYDDVNGNCIQDPGEAGIANIQIYCSGIGYTYTDASGNYSFRVPTGSYTISETILTFYPLAACQLNNIPVSVTAASGCVHTVNFANSINTIHDIHVSTWDYNFAIPGNVYHQVSVVSNDGTVTESSILAGYKPDGQILAPSFVPSGIFSGSPYYYSTGSSFPSLAPGATQTFYMNYNVPTDIPMGTSVVFKDSAAYTAPMSNWLTDYSPWNNVNYFITPIVSSYDPNFKEVSPKGVGAEGTITASDSVLEYMVHFQNTGTAPAQNIVVLDTLDDNLDWTSLRPVYQSAQCQVTLTQVGSYHIAKFYFENIYLPAQSTDDLRSNGMFTYTIKTKSGLAAGSQFKNKAYIYFDYNAPVVTNTTLNTLGSAIPTSVSNVAAAVAANSFAVYPNPASDNFYSVINSDNAAAADMKVSDITGKTLISKTINLQKGTQTISTDINQLTPGIYFVTLNYNGKSQTQKLVVMK